MESNALTPDPGKPKAVTNADEQDVAVNHSTKEDGGYDEPATSREIPPAAGNTDAAGRDEVKEEVKTAKVPQPKKQNDS